MNPMQLLNEADGMFSASERAVMLEGLFTKQISLEFLEKLTKARKRTIKKAKSDKRTDEDRRQLVGARVEKERYERYKEAADERGVSLYRFTIDALDKAVEQMC